MLKDMETGKLEQQSSGGEVGILIAGILTK